MVGDVENPIVVSTKNDETKVSIEMVSPTVASDKNDNNLMSNIRIDEAMPKQDDTRWINELQAFAKFINVRNCSTIRSKMIDTLAALSDLAENLYAITNFDKSFRYKTVSSYYFLSIIHNHQHNLVLSSFL